MKQKCLLRNGKAYILFFVFPFIFQLNVKSQPSLMADDIIDLVIQHRGQDETYTVLRDAFNRSQWYYVPKQPRLSEVRIDGVDHPELTLIRYQFEDPTSVTGSAEGGLLLFAISLSMEPSALTALQNKLLDELNSRQEGSTENLSLSALPIKKAHAAVYKPSVDTDSIRLSSNVFGGGAYPIFATQKVPFALRLTRWDSELNDALIGNSTTSNTGIPIYISFTFQAVTPPAHLKITANYSKLFSHYSEDKAFAAKASYYGLFGASSEIRWSTIRENLRQNGELTVEKIGNDEIDEKTMDAVMQAVMKRVNDNIFQVMAPPTAISPAATAAPSLSGYFGAVGYNATFKTVDQISTIDDVFEWTERRIVDRESLAGGFIGIGKYAAEIRARAVKFVLPLQWDLAHLTLPDMADQEVTQVNIQAVLLNRQTQIATKSAVWRQSTGWQSQPGNRPLTTLDFSIAPYINNGASIEDLKFRITTTVLQAGRNTELTQTINAFHGAIPIAPPVEGFTIITIDPTHIQFKGINDINQIRYIDVVVTVGNRQPFQQVIQPKIVNGRLQNPTALRYIVRSDEITAQPIRVVLHYGYDNGTENLIIENLLNSNHNSTHYFIKDIRKINP